MKNVLLALVGMSPAVLTETVWGLVVEKNVIPDEIVVLTTTEGRTKIENDLLKLGVWERMMEALSTKIKDKSKLKNLEFGEGSIKVFISKNKKDVLRDITNKDENEAVANFIMEQVRYWCDEDNKPETRVWASLAGGRKTMSALMLSCMSLLGKGDDKVLHVLVNSPYDGPLDPPFFFPEKNKKHETMDGKIIKSSDANINLIEVPFVKMKGWYSDKYKTKRKNMPTYKELVEMVQGSDFPKIEIDYENASLTVNGNSIQPLKKQEFAVLALKVGSGVADLHVIQKRLKKVDDELKRIYDELKKKTKKSPLDIEWELSDSKISLWRYAKKNKIDSELFNDQTPEWVKDIKESFFSDEIKDGVSIYKNSLRTKLKKYLPDNLDKFLPNGSCTPVDYPKDRIEEKGKNPFRDICDN